MDKKIKRILAGISAVSMLFAAMAVLPEDACNPIGRIIASAETQAGDGWSFDDTTGTLTITTNNGTTDWRTSYSYSDMQLVQSVEIQKGVTYIKKSAFSYCSNLTTITIPNSVAVIEAYAFQGCSRLKTINLPNSVNYIGIYAFESCSNLAAITIPDSVTSINSYAFQACSSLDNILYPDSLDVSNASIPNTTTQIKYTVDGGRMIITNVILGTDKNTVEIPNGVTSISNYAFDGCSSLTAITIPDSVTSIDYSAFQGCSSLTEITIPPNVKIINNSVFQNCSRLTTVRIPESVEAIGRSAFQGCSSLKTIDLPNSVNYISTYAFQDCSSLTAITIPEGVTSIGNSTFAGCSKLTSITIPDSVTSIGDTVFYGCTSLTSIVIPSGVTSIGRSAFASCDKLDTVMYPDGLDVSGASIPEATTRIAYTMDGDRIIITNIILGEGKTKVELPQSVDGKEIVHEHTGGTATCIEQAVCEMCGVAYGEIVEHTYKNSKCTVCGAYEDGVGALLTGYSISLSGNIGVNFYMSLDESVLADETAYMQFNLPNGTTSQVNVSEAKTEVIDGETYHIFPCQVVPKEYYDEITAQIITASGAGKAYRYSVYDYCYMMKISSSKYGDEIAALASAIILYCQHADCYFKNSEYLAIESEIEAITTADLAGFKMQTSGELPNGISYSGSTLLLESNTTVRHYFKVKSGVDVSKYGFTGEKDGYYYKDFTNISAANLATMQDFKVGGWTISYSPMSYAYAVLSKDTATKDLKDLVKSLYLYQQAAVAYQKR